MASAPGTIHVYLQPGEHFVGDADYTIRTLLGSCVSITLWHPALRVGAMSHFLLPHRPAGQAGGLDGRYGEEALQLMLEELKQRGIDSRECESKLFGGANMFPGQAATDTMRIGMRNGHSARELLQAHGIPVVSAHLFGIGHRQIIFHVATGEVWARQLPLPDARAVNAAHARTA